MGWKIWDWIDTVLQDAFAERVGQAEKAHKGVHVTAAAFTLFLLACSWIGLAALMYFFFIPNPVVVLQQHRVTAVVAQQVASGVLVSPNSSDPKDACRRWYDVTQYPDLGLHLLQFADYADFYMGPSPPGQMVMSPHDVNTSMQELVCTAPDVPDTKPSGATAALAEDFYGGWYIVGAYVATCRHPDKSKQALVATSTQSDLGINCQSATQRAKTIERALTRAWPNASAAPMIWGADCKVKNGNSNSEIRVTRSVQFRLMWHWPLNLTQHTFYSVVHILCEGFDGVLLDYQVTFKSQMNNSMIAAYQTSDSVCAQYLGTFCVYKYVKQRWGLSTKLPVEHTKIVYDLLDCAQDAQFVSSPYPSANTAMCANLRASTPPVQPMYRHLQDGADLSLVAAVVDALFTSPLAKTGADIAFLPLMCPNRSFNLIETINAGTNNGTANKKTLGTIVKQYAATPMFTFACEVHLEPKFVERWYFISPYMSYIQVALLFILPYVYAFILRSINAEARDSRKSLSSMLKRLDRLDGHYAKNDTTHRQRDSERKTKDVPWISKRARNYNDVRKVMKTFCQVKCCPRNHVMTHLPSDNVSPDWICSEHRNWYSCQCKLNVCNMCFQDPKQVVFAPVTLAVNPEQVECRTCNLPYFQKIKKDEQWCCHEECSRTAVKGTEYSCAKCENYHLCKDHFEGTDKTEYDGKVNLDSDTAASKDQPQACQADAITCWKCEQLIDKKTETDTSTSCAVCSKLGTRYSHNCKGDEIIHLCEEHKVPKFCLEGSHLIRKTIEQGDLSYCSTQPSIDNAAALLQRNTAAENLDWRCSVHGKGWYQCSIDENHRVCAECKNPKADKCPGGVHGARCKGRLEKVVIRNQQQDDEWDCIAHGEILRQRCRVWRGCKKCNYFICKPCYDAKPLSNDNSDVQLLKAWKESILVLGQESSDSDPAGEAACPKHHLPLRNGAATTTLESLGSSKTRECAGVKGVCEGKKLMMKDPTKIMTLGDLYVCPKLGCDHCMCACCLQAAAELSDSDDASEDEGGNEVGLRCPPWCLPRCVKEEKEAPATEDDQGLGKKARVAPAPEEDREGLAPAAEIEEMEEGQSGLRGKKARVAPAPEEAPAAEIEEMEEGQSGLRAAANASKLLD